MSKKARVLAIISICLFIVLLIMKADVCMDSARRGLVLFGMNVLPAMFPFFFFSKLLTSLDFASGITKFVAKPTKFLFNSPPIGSYIMMMSMLSGYPIGAKLICDCYQQGLINTEEAKSIVAFSQTSSPLFIIGTIAVGMMQNYLAGIIILASHYLGAVLNGIVFKNRKLKIEEKSYKNDTNIDNILSDTINNSVSSILVVGGYIIIFNVLLDILVDIGLFALLEDVLLKYNIAPAYSRGILYSIIEVTRGVMSIAQGGLDTPNATALIAMAVSFGGLSITMQAATFLSRAKIKLSYYLKIKSVQAIITFFIALALTKIIL